MTSPKTSIPWTPPEREFHPNNEPSLPEPEVFPNQTTAREMISPEQLERAERALNRLKSTHQIDNYTAPSSPRHRPKYVHQISSNKDKNQYNLEQWNKHLKMLNKLVSKPESLPNFSRVTPGRIRDFQEDVQEHRDSLEDQLGSLINYGSRLNVPVSLRDALIQTYHRQFFQNYWNAILHTVQKEMLDRALDPEKILQYDGKDLKLNWGGECVDLNFLLEHAKKGGISAKEIQQHVDQFQDQLKKTNAFMITGDMLIGTKNYYQYLLPPGLETFANKHLPGANIRTLRERLDPQSWKQDLYRPLENGVKRFLYVF